MLYFLPSSRLYSLNSLSANFPRCLLRLLWGRRAPEKFLGICNSSCINTFFLESSSSLSKCLDKTSITYAGFMPSAIWNIFGKDQIRAFDLDFEPCVRKQKIREMLTCGKLIILRTSFILCCTSFASFHSITLNTTNINTNGH